MPAAATAKRFKRRRRRLHSSFPTQLRCRRLQERSEAVRLCDERSRSSTLGHFRFVTDDTSAGGACDNSNVSTRADNSDTEERKTTGAELVERLYDSFNRCDVDSAASCFADDVVYEDLALGDATIIRSREDFRELISTHPVFVEARFCKLLNLPPLDIKVKIDGISEDLARGTVGVEWHVEVSGSPVFLGRGVSFMNLCPQTGLIQHAVDMAEAPWRAVGLILAPFARGLQGFTRRVTIGVTSFVKFWAVISVVVPWLFILIFIDQRTMDNLRAEVDFLDDFRQQLDMSSLIFSLAMKQ